MSITPKTPATRATPNPAKKAEIKLYEPYTCPFCGADGQQADVLEFGPFDSEGPAGWRRVNCIVCGHAWDENYLIVNAEEYVREVQADKTASVVPSTHGARLAWVERFIRERQLLITSLAEIDPLFQDLIAIAQR